MLISGMQTVIDGIFVGNFIGSNAMASISVAAPFLQIVIGFSMLVSVGSLSFIGRSLGSKDTKLTQDIFKTALIFLSIISTIFSVLGFLFSYNIASLLGANDILIANVSIYIKIVSLCVLPMSLSFLLGFADRLVEKPELYFKGMILSLFINITLNYLLIKQLNFGIAGAAFATGISYSSVFLIVLSPMLNKKNVITIFVGNFNKKTLWPMIYNGSSEGLASIASATSAYLFNMAFMQICGETGIAAFTSINYIAQFGTLIVFGIADGVGSILSFNYGAEKFDRVKKTFNLSIKISLVIGIITFITLFFFSENLITLFVASDESVMNIAIQGSKLYAFAFLINGFNTITSSYFTSIGLAKESIIIATCRGLIFIILGITVLPKLFFINGIWLTVPFAEILTLLISSSLIKKFKLPNLKKDLPTPPLENKVI